MLSPPSPCFRQNSTLGHSESAFAMLAQSKTILVQKIRGDYMNNKSFCLGIDVSKSKLDCSLYDGKIHKSFCLKENDLNSAKKIINHYKINPEECLVVMEATSIYQTTLFHTLYQADFIVVVENPHKISSFGKSLMIRAKTDSIDAKLIANYGYERRSKLKPTIPREEYQEKIAHHLKLIESYKADIVRMDNRIEGLFHNYIDTGTEIKSLNFIKDKLENEIEKLEKKILSIIKKNCQKLFDNYSSIKGVGKTIAAATIAYFGDFSMFEDAKKAAAFVGICPCPRESGKSLKKTASIKKNGNPYLRKLLYMGSLNAMRHNRSCRNLYNRMTSKGKSGKVALIAVAHKLLRQLFGIAKSGNLYLDNYEILAKCA
jgi:transposase